MSHEDEEFETHDIYLAAYLQEAGCEMKRRRKQGTRVYFAFSNVGGSVKALQEAFFSGKGMVSASKYADLVRKYKEMCHFSILLWIGAGSILADVSSILS